MEMPDLPDDMPEELKTMIREVTNAEFTISVGLMDAVILSKGLDSLTQRLTQSMEGADPKKVASLAHGIADIAILKNRLSTAANARLSDLGGGIDL